MREIHLKFSLPDYMVKELEGVLLNDSHYDTLISENCKVYKPNGDILLVMLKHAIPYSLGKRAHTSLLKVPFDLSNRGTAVEKASSKKHNLSNGTISKTNRVQYWKMERLKRLGSGSGIIGYSDRYARIPYCRLTAFNEHNLSDFKTVYPMLKEIDSLYEKYVPEKYALQRFEADRTSSDFVIKDTSFTTVTVNHNWQTASHYDAGDFEKGLGNLTCLRAGKYKGGYLVFPKYRVAVDLDSCDVVLMDVHELHGNTPLIGKYKSFQRISVVCYYRKNMINCGTMEEEIERAKRFGAKELHKKL